MIASLKRSKAVRLTSLLGLIAFSRDTVTFINSSVSGSNKAVQEVDAVIKLLDSAGVVFDDESRVNTSSLLLRSGARAEEEQVDAEVGSSLVCACACVHVYLSVCPRTIYI